MIRKFKSIKQLCEKTLRSLFNPANLKKRSGLSIFNPRWEGGRNIWGPTFDREIPTYYRGLLG